jgi:hypothetical protein
MLLGSLLSGSGAMAAQSLPAASVSAPAPRVLGDWRGSASVAVAHSTPSINPAAIDLGPAPANQALGRMLLLLAPSPTQQQALAAELASLQNSSSPSYHQWLTPQAFAQSYANNASDVAAVAAWLQSQGFTVAPLPAGLGWIEFSGTAAQVEQAFGAQVHLVSVFGSTRAMLSTGITVPGVLSPVVAGLVSLDGVLSTPALTAPQPLTVSAADLASRTSPATAAAFTPQLAAQLLDVTPLSAQGINGAGQTIAIVSRSNITSADVAAFRAAFGLPASSVQISVNGPDPGLSDDQAEATFAASWAGAAAPGAQILLAPAATTAATDGVDLSLAYLVDNDLANVIAIGDSACEAALSPTHQAFYSALYQQAAAEGITVIAATGDGGAAACTPAGGAVPVDTGLGVNALASTPWNTAVGVAGYGAGGAAAGTSALAAWSPVNPADPAYASGGGISTIYARKVWQPVPAGTATAGSAASQRLLPDLALPTALDSAMNPGLAFCLSGSAATSGCTLVRSGGSGVATAFFAGVAALINQKNGVQGNLAPSLYATSRISGVFNDVAQGTAQLACVPGSSGCDANGLIGYAAGSGYDLATGLGVPDVQQLVNRFATSSITIGTLNFALSMTPTETSNTYNPSAPVTFTVTVTDTTGTSAPTGSVAVSNSSTGNNFTPVATLAPSGSAASSATWTIEPLNLYNYAGTGSYNLGLNYEVNGSGSLPTGYISTITFSVSPTVLTMTPSTTSPTLGSNVTFTVTLGIVATGPPAGSVAPTGAITLTVNGTALTPVALTTTGGVSTAVITVPITAASNSIVASYPGDSNYGATTATPYILKASEAATTVSLTASATTAQPGVPITFTAVVSPTTTPVGTTEPNPSGTVLFFNGTTQIGSGTLSAGPGANSSTATLTVSTLPNGADSITAVYQGDSTYGTSTSTVLTLNVSKAATTVSLTASATTAQPGTSVTLTAIVSPVITPGSGVEQNPSGNVEFFNGASPIGSGTLSTGPGVNSATATLTLSTLPNGADSITAVYQGDSTYETSTSTAVIVTVAKAVANVVLTANSTTVQPGAAVILTVTVSPTIAPIGTTEPNPSGTVYFYDGTTVIGMAQLTPVALNDSSTATLTTQTLPGGSDQITAVYQGDSTYGAATSNVLTVNVQGFTLSAATYNPPTNLDITKGGAASESFVVTSIGGYSSLVQVICTVPTQDDMTCAISPQQVTPTAAGTTVTFVVETYVTGGPAYASLNKPARPGPLWPRAAGGAMLAGLVFFLLPFGRRARVFLRQVPRRFIIFLMLLAGLVGTGIGCTSTATTATTSITANTGTPLGVATLEVTATAYVDNAVVAQNLYFTVNVQPQ